MQLAILLAVLALLTAAGYRLGRRRAVAVAERKASRLHSLPSHYGLYVALWAGLPALMVLAAWLILGPLVVQQLVLASLPEAARDLPPHRWQLLLNEVRNLAGGSFAGGEPDPALRAAVARYESLRLISAAALAAVVLAVAVAGTILGWRSVSPTVRARNAVERVLMALLIASSTIAVFTTIGIVLSLLFEAIRFFEAVPVTEFLFGLHWSPQTAIRPDQVGSSGAFGAVPLFVGTLLISAIALLVAVPVGLFSAIYMAEYASPRFRNVAKPLLEILAGIPTVVYGFFAALIVAPVLRESGGAVGLDVASGSALAAGVVMGIMIIPFVSSLSDDVIAAVPRSLREGSYGLGATRSETIIHVTLPAALPGIVGSVLLAASRAIGETMIVVMAAGLAANLTVNPLEAVTTVTVQIVALLVGDQEFDSPKTLAAFALGLVLFMVTLALNVLALRIVNKYRERYD